jgi:hypothetical protein
MAVRNLPGKRLPLKNEYCIVVGFVLEISRRNAAVAAKLSSK